MRSGRCSELWKRRRSIVTALLLFNPTGIRSMMIQSGLSFCSRTITRRTRLQQAITARYFSPIPENLWTNHCFSGSFLGAHRNSRRNNGNPKRNTRTNTNSNNNNRRRSYSSYPIVEEEFVSFQPSSMPKRKGGKAKFYAVALGRAPGIYSTWDECQSQVKGFSNAKFKSFGTHAEAESFIEANGQKNSNNGISGEPAFSRLAASLKRPRRESTGDSTNNEKGSLPSEPVAPPIAPVLNSVDPSKDAVPLGGTKASATSKTSMKMKRDREEEPSKDESDVPSVPPYKLLFHVMFDGGSRGNPHGHAGAGTYVVASKHYSEEENKSTIIHDKTNIRTYLGFGQLTNNQAEYQGLVSGLETIQETVRQAGNGLREVAILVQGDSDLIIKQMNGVYACKSPKLKAYHQKAKNIVQSLQRSIGKSGKLCLTFEHVYRENNKIADGLANEAMDSKRSWRTASTVTQNKRSRKTTKKKNAKDVPEDEGPIEV